MSSILELPIELFMALSLAAAPAVGEEASWHGRQQSRATPAAHVHRAAADDARGPLLFAEQRWLAALKRSGVAPAYASRIFATSTGRLYTPLPAERAAVLSLRSDLALAGQVAYLEARANAVELTRLLSRPPSIAELHAAHLLGARAAARLTVGALARPDDVAAPHIPALLEAGVGARDNQGRPLTFLAMMQMLRAASARHGTRSEAPVMTADEAVRAWQALADADHRPMTGPVALQASWATKVVPPGR